MVDKCINGKCRKKWTHFSDGAVYLLEKRSQGPSPRTAEFFWLCPACTPDFIVAKDKTGAVVARPKSGILHPSPPDPYCDLRIVFFHQPGQPAKKEENIRGGIPAQTQIADAGSLSDKSRPADANAVTAEKGDLILIQNVA